MTTPDAATTTAAGGSDPVRRIQLTPASAVKMRAVRWTWEQRIPAGAITLVPGREGIGKSLFLAWLTAQITNGTLPGQHYGEPRQVFYAASEDSWGHTIAPRLYAAGADLDRVFRVEIDTDGVHDALTLPRDCDALAIEIVRMNVGLLAADPLLSLIAAGIDTHRDRELRQALEPLARLADTTGCAVVGLAHFNKSDSTDVNNLITGSRAFSAVPRAVIGVARDVEAGDGSCVLSQAKNNLGPLDLPSLRYIIESCEIRTEEGPTFVGRLVFTGECERSVDEILRGANGRGQGATEADRVTRWLTDYLTAAGGAVRAADVFAAAEEDGITKRTLQRFRAGAGVDAVREGQPSYTVWRFTDSDNDAAGSPVAPQSRQSRQLPERGATGATGENMAPLDIDRHPQSPPRLVDVSRSRVVQQPAA